jgi:hypothetical protein
MSMKFGFELEFFLKDKKGAIVLPDYSWNRDGGGILVEARGEPDNSPILAKTRLEIAITALKKKAKEKNLKLVLANKVYCDAKTIHLAQKGKNLSGEVEKFVYPTTLKHRSPGEHFAGLHVHFSDTTDYIEVTKGKNPSGYKNTKHSLFDMFKWVKVLDREFGNEILNAGRYKGAYKMKNYGFEYRSLPAQIKLDKVVEVIEGVQEGRLF